MMTMNASRAMRGPRARHCGWLLTGLALLGGGGWTMATAQDVVAAGESHSCAVVFGGLQCWGRNDDGQLGNGTTTESRGARPVLLDGTVTAVAAGGSHHTCAIVTGALICWGSDASGELGDGRAGGWSTTPAPVLGLDGGVTAVAAGKNHTCAVINGGLKCWGSNGSGQLGTDSDPGQLYPTPMDVFTAGGGVTAVAAGDSHTCAVVNGKVQCWGFNSNGQLGTGDQINSPTPVSVAGISEIVVGVAAGKSHTCALLDTGGVQCWGHNGDGQLGDNSFNESWVPVTVYRYTFTVPPDPIPLSGALAITAGGAHTCAATSSGAYCWGANGLGQLGVGSTENYPFGRPVSTPGTDMTSVSAGYEHTCAVANGAVVCWGSDEFGQLGYAAASPYVPTPAASMTDFYHASHISAGRLHGCVANNGGAFCWGYNALGQLGTGTFVNSASPQGVSGLGVGSGIVATAAGVFHSCAMRTFDVKCWGYNGYGQLGNGSLGSASTPVSVAGLSDPVSIATGRNHTCAARSSGSVQCWGSNEHGQLGDNTSNDSPLPVTVMIGDQAPVPLSGATAVTAGYAHNCAPVNGGAYCWGVNGNGQLGNNSQTDSHRAVPVVGLGPDSTVTMISAGFGHTCAVVGAAVQCWGDNNNGQLGNGTDDDSMTPVGVSGLTGSVSAVTSGDTHTCAVVDDGVQCWGSNQYGQLGTGSFNSSSVPVTALPPGSGVTAVTAGQNYTCAISTANGATTTRCWGNGMLGRLANGELGYKDVPVSVIDRIFAHGFGGD